MEAREPVSPALFGGDNDVPVEDDLWRESRGALFRRTSGADAGAMCGLEPDDASGNAAELCGVSVDDYQL